MRDPDTMIDAIALSSPSGRMSKRARNAAMKRLVARLFPADLFQTKEPSEMSVATIAGEVREMMNPNTDNYPVGQIVLARFTNSGGVHEFKGEIVGRTKNYWKVKAITSPYQNEQPGRVFHIATLRSRIYSANNCIRSLA
jgi:hypothetical protein